MADFVFEQLKLEQDLHQAVLRAMPRSWVKATLHAAITGQSATGTTMTLNIDGKGQPGLAIVNDEIRDQVREIFLLHEREHTDLVSVTYDYVREPDGSWSHVQNYKYSS
jgi:hypothetical protein